MAIEDVFNPESKTKIDPKVAKEKSSDESDAEYWEKKTKAERAQREYEEERKRREKIDTPSESPFQVKGEVNLGKFDFQKQQEELRNTINKIQDDARAQIESLSKDKDDYRDRLNQIQLTMVENTLKAQIEHLQKVIQDGLAKPKEPGIADQISQITQIAGILGYSKPTASETLPAEVQLQIKKMDIENAQAQREFEHKMKVDERNWQLDLKKLDIENANRAAQISAEKEKRGVWATPFESIGSAIARGLVDSGGQISRPSTTRRKRSTHRLEAGEDDSGTLECPECGEPIAIAPRARSAVCSSCDATISISRVQGEPAQ